MSGDDEGFEAENIDIDDVDAGGGRFRKGDRPKTRWHTFFVRRQLAYWMLGLIGILSLTLIIGVMIYRLEPSTAKDLATSLIAPLFAIFGAIVGFYFGGTAQAE